MVLSDGVRGGRKSLVAVGLFAAALILNSLTPRPVFAEPDASSAMTVPEAKPEIRTLHMRHRWTGESLDVVYKIGGQYQPAAMEEINHFMRDWRCDKTTKMDPALIDKLYALQQAVGANRTIRLISGYRSEAYNASLLASGHTVDPHSEHMFGKAADIFVPGMSADILRTAAEKQGPGGVGYYPFSGPRFVHIDTGPDRRWTEEDPAERRRQGIAKPPHKRLKLDCSLTMAQALTVVPMHTALDALPQGAAVSPAPDAEKLRFMQSRLSFAGLGMGDGYGSDEAGTPAKKTPPCEADGQLEALTLLAPKAAALSSAAKSRSAAVQDR